MNRIIVIILFALLFVLVGWTAPAMYATYAPADHFVETHSFEATDATVDQETHEITWDRTIHERQSGTIVIELVMLSEDRRIEYEATTRDSIYQDGRETIVIENELPDDAEVGTYEYNMVINIQLSDGRVMRTFFITSDTFEITE